MITRSNAMAVAYIATGLAMAAGAILVMKPLVLGGFIAQVATATAALLAAALLAAALLAAKHKQHKSRLGLLRPLVIIESPYAGNIESNSAYLARALRDSLMRGEAPMASHGLYTLPGVLDDKDFSERRLGMDAGHAWLLTVDKVVVYHDLGCSVGMKERINLAVSCGVPVIFRSIGV